MNFIAHEFYLSMLRKLETRMIAKFLSTFPFNVEGTHYLMSLPYDIRYFVRKNLTCHTTCMITGVRVTFTPKFYWTKRDLKGLHCPVGLKQSVEEEIAPET